MKKIALIFLALCLFSGCTSEFERQNQVSQLELQLEQERQRLDIPRDIWQTYVNDFKDRKCGGWEYQWGKNWRYWAIRDAEEYFTSSKSSMPLIVEKRRLQDVEALLIQEIVNLNQKYDTLNARFSDFVKRLSDDELKIYEEISSRNQTNPATAELNRRRLSNIMSEEHKQMLEQMLREASDLEEQKVVLVEKINTHDQRVAAYDQRIPAHAQAVALQEQRQRETIQAFGRALQEAGEQQQQYYQRQSEWVQRENQRLQLQQINTNLYNINRTLRGW